jgi:hypothetical protein
MEDDNGRPVEGGTRLVSASRPLHPCQVTNPPPNPLGTPRRDDATHTTHPQLHEQLLMGWVVGGMAWHRHRQQ